MWRLTHTRTEQKCYLLADKKQYSVGRQNCDFVMTDRTDTNNNESISREHSIIYCTPTSIKVEDTGSKYGVFVKDGIDTQTQIPKKEKVQLSVGDIVRFGRLDNVFRLEKIPVILCTSTLDAKDTAKLREHLRLIGGKLEKVWSESCTHLVMSNVTVTLKVLQALAMGKPIVTPAYFTEYIQCARENRPQLPDVNKFIPEIAEKYLIKSQEMLQVHPDRLKLFLGKTFVFMVKRNMVSFESVIQAASGKCINLEDQRVRKSTLLKSDHIPVAYSAVGSSQMANENDMAEYVEYVQSNKRRLIQDSEIGLAIIHRSIERHCNPDYKFTTSFEASVTTSEAMRNNPLAEETPHSSKPPNQPVKSDTVPETEETNNNDMCVDSRDIEMIQSSQSQPRDFEFVSPKSAPKKRQSNPKQESSPVKTESKRRRLSDSDEEPNFALTKKQKSGNEPVAGTSNDQSSSSPLKSQSIPLSSGFISCSQRCSTRNQVAESAPPQTSQKTKPNTRKRALAALDNDSDEEKEGETTDGVYSFEFGKKQSTKRVRTAPQLPKSQTRSSARLANTQNRGDVDGENPFNLTMRPTRSQQQSQAKNETIRTFVLDFKLAQPITSDWISSTSKRELNITDNNENTSQPSVSVRIKEEKLEECEMADEEKKRKWIEMASNGFEVTMFNVSKRTIHDETDGILTNTENELNQTKNFKKFVKKRNYIPRATVVETTPFQVVVSELCKA